MKKKKSKAANRQKKPIAALAKRKKLDFGKLERVPFSTVPVYSQPRGDMADGPPGDKAGD